jgi:hypothetical protein
MYLDGERAALGAAQSLGRGDGEAGDERAGGASVARPWRDTTGDSILLVQAKAALAPWRSW